MKIQASQSEDNGISSLSNSDLKIYSIGISTGGVAEIRMAEANPKRHIVATTIDRKGVAFAKQQIAAAHFDQQIEAKIEDVTKPLKYADDCFDFVYARLVLHYLPEQDLINALAELHRVLKPGGKLFVAVRSVNSEAALRAGNRFDPITHLTTYTYTNSAGTDEHLVRRFFHSEDSLSQYISSAGFDIRYIKSYDEHLFKDFKRAVQSSETDNVIELLAVK